MGRRRGVSQPKFAIASATSWSTSCSQAPGPRRRSSGPAADHLGYEPHQEPPGGSGNTRNGSSPKTLATEHGPVRIKTPRDRNGSFEPKIVRKGQRRFEGFDDKILALYARGLSVRDIEAHLQEIYGAKVGRDLIEGHRRCDGRRQGVGAAAAR